MDANVQTCHTSGILPIEWATNAISILPHDANGHESINIIHRRQRHARIYTRFIGSSDNLSMLICHALFSFSLSLNPSPPPLYSANLFATLAGGIEF